VCMCVCVCSCLCVCCVMYEEAKQATKMYARVR